MVAAFSGIFTSLASSRRMAISPAALTGAGAAKAAKPSASANTRMEDLQTDFSTGPRRPTSNAIIHSRTLRLGSANRRPPNGQVTLVSRFRSSPVLAAHYEANFGIRDH